MIELSSASSVGSDVFVVVSILVISLVVLLLIRHFLPLRLTPSYLIVPIFLALALPASIILLVPIDLASTSASGSNGPRRVWLPERVLLVSWRISYWLCFVLTWVLLPLLGEYVDSGDRSPKERLLYSLRSNGRYQLATLGAGLIAFLYISIQLGIHIGSIRALVMGLAYFWGLFIAIYLMGHGLVAIPRRSFRKANISGSLRRIQLEAPRIHDRLEDAILSLSQLEDQVLELQQRKNTSPRDLRDWIDELADLSNLPESRASSSDPTASTATSDTPTVITDRFLADLTRKLSRARHEKARFIESWDQLVSDASHTQAVLDSAGSRRLDFGGSSPHAPFYQRITILTPYTRYLFYYRVLPSFALLLGAVFSLASACVVWSEVIKSIKVPRLSLISQTVIHSSGEDIEVGLANQIIAAAWILYMCSAALTSINDAKIWGNRALVRRNTYGESACWYASQIARLTVPLAYNFVTFFPERLYQKTTYYRFLGHFLDRTSLGEGFDRFFPIFILVPVCATLFDLYGKVKNTFGFGFLADFEGDEGDASGYGSGSWREGQDLIERELNGNSLARGSGHGSTPHAETRRPVEAGRQREVPSVANSARNSAPILSVPRDMTAQRRTRETLAARNPEDTTGDGNFFSDFAHRVRNTVDATETPTWVRNIGDGFKRPRWMTSDGQGGRSDSRVNGNWFGGRSEDGRIRL
ncbi:MAG: hypothetical protein M1837_006462 [Sclerophora amabilis]|nr:MAG: hypothetical protein M1837_006462 [Sclerophora amabilis]